MSVLESTQLSVVVSRRERTPSLPSPLQSLSTNASQQRHLAHDDDENEASEVATDDDASSEAEEEEEEEASSSADATNDEETGTYVVYNRILFSGVFMEPLGPAQWIEFWSI